MIDTARHAFAQGLLRSSFTEQAAKLARDGVRDRVTIDGVEAVQHELLNAQDAGESIGRSGATGHD
jgi:hypothetical protein